MYKESSNNRALELRHIFGIRSDVNLPLHFLDETTVVYVAGNNIVIHNIEDQTQRFISGSNHGSSMPSNGITAIDVHSTKRIIAYAEKTEKCANIHIIELAMDSNNMNKSNSINSSSNTSQRRKRRKKRSVILPDILQSHEIISLKFSFDGKFLLAIGGAPDWAVMNYQRDKGRIVQMKRNQTLCTMPFYAGSFCPTDNNLIVCIGHKIIKFFKSDQSELKHIQISLGKREPMDYTAHAWDSDRRLLVVTENGEILIFEGSEFRGVFNTQFSEPILSIITFSKGFVCGCELGTLLAFERGNEKEIYKRINELCIPHLNMNNSITHLTVPQSEEQLACITANNQVFSLNLSQIEVLKDNDSNDPIFQHLLHTAFHFKGITGLDLCIRKPYLITCGYDRTVRVWNWNENKIVISKTFTEDPLCVAMHPSGMHIVVGFADKLRLMNILMDDIRRCKDFPIKSCAEVKFSNGGQYFAAINSSAVQIYGTFTFENIATLRGHTAQVNHLWWNANDSQLITASADNSVLAWNIYTNSRTQEHQQKGCSYLSAVLAADQKTILACSADDTLQVIHEGKVLRTIELPVCVSSLEITREQQQWLFCATTAGILTVFRMESLMKENGKIFYHDIQAHTCAITRMRISYCDTMLVTCGEDGCICIFDIRDTSSMGLSSVSSTDTGSNSRRIPISSMGMNAIVDGGRSTASKKKELLQLSWAEEILVNRSDLEQKLNDIEILKTKVDDLRLHNDFEIRMKEMNYEEKLEEVNVKFQQELDQDKGKYDALKIERDEMQNKYELTLKTLAYKHEENLSEVENYHKQKIKNEKQRFKALKLNLKTIKEQWTTDKDRRFTKYESEIGEVINSYEYKISGEKDTISDISTEIQNMRIEFDLIKILLEDDADQEIAHLKINLDKLLKSERTQTLDLRGNNGTLKREFSGLQQKIKKGNDRMQRSLEEQNKLIEEIHRLEKDINAYEREIAERDSTIKEKNDMIAEIQKKNQELEKFKFVLDYKIKELDRQIKPRERTIINIDKQLTEMNDEIGKYKKDNNLLSLKIKDLKLRLKGLHSEDCAQNQRNIDLHNVIKSIGIELENVHKNSNNINILKKGIIHLHKKFEDIHLEQKSANNNSNLLMKKDSNIGVHEEFQRHKNYLERTVQGLQKKLVKNCMVFKKDSERIKKENVALIKEINNLRREIANAQQIRNESSPNIIQMKDEITVKDIQIKKLLKTRDLLLMQIIDK